MSGLRLLADGLEFLSGSSFAAALQYITQNRFSAFCCGLFFTALTQSSSLTTVVMVGMAESGLLELKTAIAIIAGANVGTTVTGQLLSFQLSDFAWPLLMVGIVLMLYRNRYTRNAGRALVGFSVLLFGLRTMSVSLKPLAKMSFFISMIHQASVHPILGIAAGVVITSLVQSSSAVVGMVLALAASNAISLPVGFAVVIGADIGTCVTSLIAAIGSGVSARRAAIAHLLFNFISVLLIMPIFPQFIRIAALSADSLSRQLANAHTLYNLSGAILLLLFLTPFEILVEKLVKANHTEKKRIYDFFSELIRKWF
ncbi:MAG: Na/Pi cotransporter family protein [Firmicutes bacterium]|nr:Na/Pi cotransporter family protein [Bacillota bacterium]